VVARRADHAGGGACRGTGSSARAGRAVALALAALLAAGTARAEEPPAPAAGAPAAAAEGAAPEELRARLAELEQERADLAALAAEWAARAAEYAQARLEAPSRLRAIERELAALRSGEAPRAPERASIAELEAALVAAEQDLALARREAADVEAEAAQRSERRRELPDLLAAARQRLQAVGEPPATGEDPRIAEAQRKLAAAGREAILREIDAHEQELASYEARGTLLARRLDRAPLRVAQAEARVGVLRDALLARQQREAERAAESARGRLEAAAELAPGVRDVVEELAEQNAELAAQRTGAEGLVGRIDDVARKLATAEESVARVEADRARLASKLEAAGLTGSVGLLLRKQRADAPDVGKYRRFIRMRRELISETQVRQIELREARRELADVDALVARAMAGVDADLSSAERAEIESLLRDLLETKRKVLDALISDHEAYFQKLVDFDAKQQELVEKTEDLLRFIDERILWIPSGTLPKPGLVADAGAALAWLFDPRYWAQLGRALVAVLAATPVLNASLAIAGALFAALGARVRARIRALGDVARQPSCARFAPTAEALCLTLLLVPWIPGAVAYLGWRILGSPEATLFARCFGGAALAAGAVWLSLELPRQILRRGGIAEAHLGLPEAAVGRLRRDLGALAAAAPPLVWLVQILELRDENAWKESIGRLAFLLLAAIGAGFAWRWLGRRDAPIARIAGAAAPGWRWRLVQAVALGVPALLAAGALAGYYWTALRLAARYHWTLAFLFALALAAWLSRRWSMLARRRLAIERAREREAARAAQRAQAAAGEAVAEEAEEPLDLAAVDAQTGRLLQGSALVAGLLGLWLIWAEVLPAAGILREVELWSTTQTVTFESTDAAGRPLATSVQRAVPVTLPDLLGAVVIAALALLLVRNLPGLLELSLFRRTALGPGERYAYATLAKYAVGLAGLALACGSLGLGWSNIQWLVAAVGIGLGFGLQEIFANFVSGLILLFERPIRVGDTVTIGDVSGTVSRIRIRATWITGGDRKEHVVPNKEFVTGRLVNWTLSDTVLRLQLRVGIAYGSDVERALAILREVALQNEHVLRDPRPEAWFVGFGESTLDLELSAFSPDAAHLAPIRHALHLAIDRAFRAAGIEIAYPQRDLHLRTLPAPRPDGPA
jgi:potassium efflux system protein